MNASSTVACLLACLLVCSCEERNRWEGQQSAPNNAINSATTPATNTNNGAGGTDATRNSTFGTSATSPQTARIILFAPVALGPLVEINPAAKLEYAQKEADYVDLLVSDADGRFGEHLPASDADEWTRNRIAAAGGAHLVVLTRVLELRPIHGISDSRGANNSIQAVVDMRGIDASGNIIFDRRALGEAIMAGSPKFIGANNCPESLASWQAISTALGRLKAFLDDTPSLSNIPHDKPIGPNPDDIHLIEVVIDSDPARADVLIDGMFRGTTPQTIPLPVRNLTVRIERQGYQPWQRELTPVKGMRIQPALEPVQRTQAIETPVPATQTQNPAAQTLLPTEVPVVPVKEPIQIK